MDFLARANWTYLSAEAGARLTCVGKGSKPLALVTTSHCALLPMQITNQNNIGCRRSGPQPAATCVAAGSRYRWTVKQNQGTQYYGLAPGSAPHNKCWLAGSMGCHDRGRLDRLPKTI